MSHTRRFVAAVAALSLAGLAATAAVRQRLERGAVLAGEQVFQLQPAQLIAGPEVQSVLLSPQQDRALIVRNVQLAPENPSAPPQPDSVEVIVWDSVSRRPSVVFQARHSASQHYRLTEPSWLPGTNTALLTLQSIAPDKPSEPIQQILLRVDTVRRDVSRRPITPGERLEVAGKAPVAALVDDTAHTLRVLRADGSFARAFTLPENRWVGLSDDGTALVARGTGKQPLTLLSLETGSVTTSTKPLQELFTYAWNRPAPVEKHNLPLKVLSSRTALTPDPNTAAARSLWLVGTTKETQGRILVSADGNKAGLLASGVLFEQEHALFLAPIAQTPKVAYLRQRLMNNGKQIGLALMMYAQDYDENFPPTDGAIKDVLDPYLKNPSVFTDPFTGKSIFQANYTQTALGKFASPATDVLGYLTGSGGRAVIYADGHIRWEGQ